ncbi:MAG TPA: hypothetical protein EYP40_01400 [Chromatiales bacterium]|nr:hypothetical protein [Chromatiales bacterium]
MRVFFLLFPLLVIAGCQAPPGVKQLEDEKQALQQELESSQQQLAKLEAERQQLQAQLDESRHVIAVLDSEKTARVSESSTLRSQVRRFVQREIDELKAFLVNSNLLDYVGGELVRRKLYDQKPIMLIDLQNRIPRPGTLTGFGGYFVKPTTLKIKLLRPVNDRLVVIWESRLQQVNGGGLVRGNFAVSVGVEKGDVLGYWFPKAGNVTFDKGTGNTRYLTRDVPLGSRISPSSLYGDDDKRSYSLGVFGLLK